MDWTKITIIAAIGALSIALVVHKVWQHKYGEAYTRRSKIKGDVNLSDLPYYFWFGISLEITGGAIGFESIEISKALSVADKWQYLIILLAMIVFGLGFRLAWHGWNTSQRPIDCDTNAEQSPSADGAASAASRR
jgi:hypothetical protein